MNPPIIHWFRRDLRRADNPALSACVGRPVLGVFIWEEEQAQARPAASIRPMGGAAKWRLLRGLEALEADLRRDGINLVMARGEALPILGSIAGSIGARSICANRIPEPDAQDEETILGAALAEAGLELVLHDSALLFPPPADPAGESRFRRSFSGFARAAQIAASRISSPAGRPELQPFVLPLGKSLPKIRPLVATDLYRGVPDWAAGFDARDCGEAAALARWRRFLENGLATYADRRDAIDGEGGSGLSAHLHWGEISVHRLWTDLANLVHRPELAAGSEKFTSELLWREFSHHALAHCPDMADAPLQPDFGRFPWREAPAEYDAWRHGQTGYPIIDALMRCLWQTGRMSNRGRMIGASFLTKHLLIDWRRGESWFWNCLLDASAATNPFSWQWVAGCGVDAAPFFRIFNPVLQSGKFDPDGSFIRKFVPELAALPTAFIHHPWTAPATLLTQAGIRLGRDYPLPMVDHSFARQRALDAFASLRKTGS